jgi:adenylate cyclase
VRAFQVLSEGESRVRLPKVRRRWPAAVVAAATLLAIITGGGVYWYQANVAPGVSESAAPKLPDKPSIAVLPFTNLSDDKTQEYFADGLTDDLIIDLSKLSGLFVIARNSVFTFKGQPVRIEQVAKELGVHYVVEGSVRRIGGQVRVNAQLVDGQTGHHVWAQRYDRKTEDLFAVQDDLVTRIVSSLAVQLTQTEETQLVPRAATEFKAYDLYLQARDGYFSRDQTRMRQSLNFYIEAWTIDPGFARAYAGYARLAADIWRLSALRGISGATLRRSAELAARKAIAIDSNLSDTYSVLALMSMVDKDHEDAITLARRAVQLDPNSADAHTTLSIVLSYAGQTEAALDASKTSMRLNPRPAPYHLIYYGFALFLNQNYEEAIAVLEPIAETRDRGLGDAPREILAMAYAMSDRAEDARAAIAAMKLEEPFLNLAYYRVVYDHQEPKEALNQRLDALRRAGLPEWPLSFDGDQSQQLAGSTLGSLIVSTTWSGKDDGRRAPFVQEFGTDGGTVYATQNAILNGKAFLRGDELCERYEGFVLGRALCGPVFRINAGQAENGNDFAYVNPTTVRYFSITD